MIVTRRVACPGELDPRIHGLGPTSSSIPFRVGRSSRLTSIGAACPTRPGRGAIRQGELDICTGRRTRRSRRTQPRRLACRRPRSRRRSFVDASGIRAFLRLAQRVRLGAWALWTAVRRRHVELRARTAWNAERTRMLACIASERQAAARGLRTRVAGIRVEIPLNGIVRSRRRRPRRRAAGVTRAPEPVRVRGHGRHVRNERVARRTRRTRVSQ